LGSISIGAAGETVDISPDVLDGAVVWQLGSGQYEARGSGSILGGQRFTGGKRGFSAFPNTSFSRAAGPSRSVCSGSFRTAQAASTASGLSGGGGWLKRRASDGISERSVSVERGLA
jgi:hypothetical protein